MQSPSASPADPAPADVDEGTVSVWVKPQWITPEAASAPVIRIGWSSPQRGQIAVSQDRSRAPRFNLVLNDGRDFSCSPRFGFPYVFFLHDQWTQLVVTWRSGVSGQLRWFIDGKILCERASDFMAEPRASSTAGLELPAAAYAADATLTVDRVQILNRAWSAAEVHRAFLQNGGESRAKWAIALTAAPAADPATRERRVMQDEDTQWSSSKAEIIRRVQRLQEAGFNVYVPNVWNGAQMFCVSGVAPMSPSIRDPLDPDYDPLAFLITEAHKRGIDVQPWIYVVGRQPGGEFPASFTDGSPAGAFNVHSGPFRDYIVALAVDLAKRHDIDGLNLDYIRAVGPCTAADCVEAYRQKYGRSLSEDWKISAQGTSVPSLVEFNRRAVSEVVSRISSGVRALRPRAVLTVDSVLFDYSRSQQGLDEEQWLARGMIDAVMNMSYDDPVDVDSLDRASTQFAARQRIIVVRNYDIFGADVRNRSGAAMADYVRLVRRRWPGAGVGVYHYMHMDSDQLAGFAGVFSAVGTARAN